MPARSRSLLVTGSSGLIGSEVCAHFSALGWAVHGVDANLRAVFFGPDGDTRWNQRRLEATLPGFVHHELDIRDRPGVLALVDGLRPDAVVHTAAQPSHDRAAAIPFQDFDTNAVGTLNLLEAARRSVPEAPFVHMSTNKVYGDAPNERPLDEHATRWDYALAEDYDGIDESCRIDRSKHSLFGASKVAADVMVQEYGRYFGMPTVCLRGGCLTGPMHAGVELHGFLSFLVKCVLEGRPYTVFGYKGKQVRDNIHAHDVARLIEQVVAAPRVAEVYNVGGGRANACSVIEAFALAESVSGRTPRWTVSEAPREGDHICYISDLAKLRAHYPAWRVTRSLPGIVSDIHDAWQARAPRPLSVPVAGGGPAAGGLAVSTGAAS